MATNPRIRYDIEAAVTGESDVNALAAELEGLSKTLEGDLKVQAQASAEALRELGAKQGAIENFRSLKTEAQSTAERLEEAQAAAQRLGAQLAASGGPTRQQAGQMQRLRDNVRAAKDELLQKNVALDQSRASLRAVGISTDTLAQSERGVRAAISEARAEVQALAPAYTAAGNAAADAGRKQAQSTAAAGAGLRGLGNELDKVDAKSSVLNTSLTAVGKAVAGLFALNKAAGFATDTIALADAYGQMAERIAMATPVAEEYDLVQQRILATANLTYRRLEEQQELYIRTADALRDMSYSTNEALDITDSFSFLLTTNAASAERGKNAIDAYTKSIQSGRIEVGAWQSIMAATPTIVNAVAQATGKTADEIRRLGITGKLSVNDLNEGLRQTVELNKEAAAGMSATVADAVTRLTNTWTQYVGEANRATQSTQKIVDAIDMLSENLDTVVSLAITAGEVMAVVWGIKALTALKAYTAQLAVASTQTTALMAATTAAGSKMAASLAAAGKLAASGWIGWEIGTYLKSEFEVVEKAGIALAAGLTKTIARIQGAWEAARAVFSDDTIEAAQQRLAERLTEIDDNYAELFANVGKGTEQAVGDAKRLGDAVKDLGDQVRVTAADQVEAWEASRIAKVGDAQATLANLQVQQQLARQSEDMARFMGNEFQARKAKIQQMEIEIQIARAKVEVSRVEAEGSIAVAEAKLAEMRASGEVNLVKQAELESSIKLAQVKIAEAAATGQSIDLMRKQLDLFKLSSGSARGYRTEIDNLTRSQRGFAGATNDANAALQRQIELANERFSSPLGDDKYGRPQGGSVTGNTREERLAGQNAVDNTLIFALREKLNAGTLTSQDAKDLTNAIAALDQNEAVNRDLDRMNPAAFSLTGAADRNEWRAVRQQFEQALKATQVGRRVTVELRNGRQSETVNTDEEGAAAIVRTLQNSALSAGR
ncbi:tape measure protein [Hydrogenophaga sp.]|uniref:tape measure protein n=1 Tax=Hydrogenophaga sp. TaxID=1904254 RepID=UPI002719121B|nr:tape measure protein [Hydrogenophaga sp.]MDO8903965.1 tape measure protein [Hydrogenophaga sp.]